MPQSSLQQKLNFDTNALGNSGDTGIGGFIHDFMGNVMRTFSISGVVRSINEAKLLIGVREACNLEVFFPW